ncbi:imm11 family protein, partial [Altererythrobacter sp.]|uniref:imm11 family protein n=1 Tax=Altererythrobacter sp. TaxID=1872480 RepID=UPI003D12DE51
MVWWLKKNMSYLGPDFDWVGPECVEEKRGLVGSGLSLSRPLSEKNVPKAARSRRPAKAPPRQDVFIVDYAVACNRRFKDLVEQFEPGLHLFVPIELQYHDGRVMEGEFYFFNCNV